MRRLPKFLLQKFLWPSLAVLMTAVISLGIALLSYALFSIDTEAVEYNKAVERANNRMLLLNIVRASKGYPLYFTDINVIGFDLPFVGTIGLAVPVGGGATRSGTLNPSVETGRKPSVRLAVRRGESLRGIYTPITMGTFDYYLNQGRPRETLFLMFVRKIEFGPNEFSEIITSFDNTCGPENMDKPEICKRFGDLLSNTELPDKPYKCDPLARDHRQFVNDPASDKDSFCRFVEFQRLIRMLMALNLRIATVEKTKGGPKFPETTKVFKYDKCMKLISRICKPTQPTQPTYGIIGLHVVAEEDEEAIAFIRSPEAMVFYMGKLLDTQIHSGGKFIPKISEHRTDAKSGKPPWKEVSLFRVRTGGSGGAAAVSVTHEGQTYYIPRDRDERGRSMHVLSLLSQIFALH